MRSSPGPAIRPTGSSSSHTARWKGWVPASTAAGPHWGLGPPPPTAPGRDIVVVLDLSRSMWATDALPNRFEMARQALRDLAGAVEKRGGHRLGLVVFAARAKVACPLTQDLDHFRQVVTDLPADGPPPDLLPNDPKAASGTRIGVWLRTAVEAFDGRRPGCRDMLLISDGDDPATDGEWQAGMQAAQRAGVAVFTVGVGDPDQGGRIPAAGGFLQFNGQDVVFSDIGVVGMKISTSRTSSTRRCLHTTHRPTPKTPRASTRRSARCACNLLNRRPMI